MQLFVAVIFLATLSGCTTAGRLQAESTSPKVESELKSQCKENDAQACGVYSVQLWTSNLPEEALVIEKKACALGDKKACGINSARSARAMVYRSKCDAGIGAFCLEFALFAGLDGHDALGASYLEKGCRAHNKASCEGVEFYQQAKAKKTLDDSQKNKMPTMAIPMTAESAPTIRISNPRAQREPADSVCTSVEVAEIFSGKMIAYRVCKTGWAEQVITDRPDL